MTIRPDIVTSVIEIDDRGAGHAIGNFSSLNVVSFFCRRRVTEWAYVSVMNVQYCCQRCRELLGCL